MELINPLSYEDDTDDKYIFNLSKETKRGTLSQVHIADLHFGVISPEIQYNIYKEQILDKIKVLPIDLVSIDGDTFDRKFMSNTDAIRYANKFIFELVLICKAKGITLIIIDGTTEHDAGQLRLFYHYLQDPDLDLRIVEYIKFEYVKGAKILCIPEMYGVEESIYRKYLFESGQYDMCFMHGTIKGAVYKDNVGQGRLFTIEDFCNCLGPIISGHVHTGGCFYSYFYYTSSPIRWKFGEESAKGFLIVLYDMDTRKHYCHLEEVTSFRYDTINLDELISSDPKDIIDYINALKEKEGIDYLRIEFTKDIDSNDLDILKTYYRNNGTISFKTDKIHKDKLLIDSENNLYYTKFSYLFDPNMNDYDKLARYINDQMGYVYISGKDIKNIVEEKE